MRSPNVDFRHSVVVGLGGLEPPTSRLSVEYSNQLSYSPIRCPALSAGRGCRVGKKGRKTRRLAGGAVIAGVLSPASLRRTEDVLQKQEDSLNGYVCTAFSAVLGAGTGFEPVASGL